MTTVLYIAGTGRSGSTLLERVVGLAPGAVAAGEVRMLWSRGLIDNRLCGCGEPVRSCPFWTTVLDRAYGGVEAIDPAAVSQSIARVTRLRHIRSVSRRRGHGAPLSTESEMLVARLYPAIAATTGDTVVVDSSKLPLYAALLDRLPHLDVRVLHLVRDPRATAYSWRRRKALPDPGAPAVMEQRSSAKTAMLWMVWNAVVARQWEHTGRYTRVRYEDFVADPQATVKTALTALGLGHLEVAIDGATVDLAVDHTAAGNPDRLENGPVEIRADVRWQTGLPRFDRALVTALTTPLRRRYGYPRRVT